MPESKTLQLFQRIFVVAGSDVDDYYRAFPSGSDVTDSVLLAIRPFLADDAICIDVGANIGLYSLAFAWLAPRGRVYAFEPSPDTFDHLSQNVQNNDLDNVETFKLALGDQAEGTVHFHDFPFFTAGSFAVDDDSFLTSEALGSNYFEAPATTLDSFVAEHGIDRIDLVKIDVEGAELSVLDGAKETLSALQPMVVLEFTSFGFTLHQGILPQAALARIRAIFPYVYVMDRRDGSLRRLSTARDTYAFLYDNGIRGPVDNLLCSFQDLGIRRGYEPLALAESTFGPAGSTVPPAESADALAESTDALAESTDALAESTDALAESTEAAPAPPAAVELLAAMHNTVSWRVTAPLRAVRTRFVSLAQRLSARRGRHP
jgi:FkbM family methyltransferase